MMTHSLMLLSAISPLHNGAGEGMGMIDRPIIRERTTDFPIIQGSTLKGVFRDAYAPGVNAKVRDHCTTNRIDQTKVIDWLFGPFENGSDHAGCISFGDAAVLAFPVRALKGSFVWATSPFVLYRFQRIAGMAGVNIPTLQSLLDSPQLAAMGDDTVLVNPASQNRFNINGKILLEEYPLNITPCEKLLPDFAAAIGRIAFDTPSFQTEFANKLVVIPDDRFKYFVRYATEVTANIRIRDDTGTTKDGSLRYTEYLPSETVLYSLLSFSKPFSSAAHTVFNDAASVQTFMIGNRPERGIIQVGGDETKGKGFTYFSFV